MAAAVDGHCAVCALRLGAEAGNLGGACEYVQVSIYIYIYVVYLYIYTNRTGDLQNCRASEKRRGLKTKAGF